MRGLLLTLLVWAGGCGVGAAFECQTDSQCGAQGQCTEAGFCSFPDEACESGQRYADNAGALSGLCVEPVAADASGKGSDGGGDTWGEDSGARDDDDDSDDNADANEDSTDASDDTTGPMPEPCTDAGLQCFAGAVGWSGPFIAFEVAPSTPPGCPADWVANGVFGRGRIAASFDCACSCNSVDACGSVTIYGTTNGTTCNPGPSLVTVGQGICAALSPDGDNDQLYFDWPEPTDDCGPATDASTFDAPTFTEQAQVCSFSGARACADGLCLPAAIPEGARRCIVAEGDQPCPAGVYADRELVYTGVADTRTCSSCSCGSMNGDPAFCQAALYDTDDCTGQSNTASVLDPTNCESLGGSMMGGSLELSTSHDCTAQGGMPSGEVLPTGPVTICCAP